MKGVGFRWSSCDKTALHGVRMSQSWVANNPRVIWLSSPKRKGWVEQTESSLIGVACTKPMFEGLILKVVLNLHMY